MREHRFLGQLQNRDRVLATHRRKVFQEMIERIPFFEAVEKRLHRHPGAREHDGAAHNLIRTCNKKFWYSHLSPYSTAIVTRKLLKSVSGSCLGRPA
jgi:hypothetical protein